MDKAFSTHNKSWQYRRYKKRNIQIWNKSTDIATLETLETATILRKKEIVHNKGQWLKITTNSRHKLEWIRCGYNKKNPFRQFSIIWASIVRIQWSAFYGWTQCRRNFLLNRRGRTDLPLIDLETSATVTLRFSLFTLYCQKVYFNFETWRNVNGRRRRPLQVRRSHNLL